MSVKFEIADWKFELTLKELVCQPAGKKSTKTSGRDFAATRKEPKKIIARKKEKLHELDYATRR